MFGRMDPVFGPDAADAYRLGQDRLSRNFSTNGRFLDNLAMSFFRWHFMRDIGKPLLLRSRPGLSLLLLRLFGY